MKSSLRGGATALFSLLTLFGGADAARAASQVFSANPADNNWANAANWTGGAVPGALTGQSNDTATFNTPLAVNPATGMGTIGGADNPFLPDAGRRIGFIVFDTANVGAYVIGTNSGNTLTLSAQASGVNGISITAPVTSSQIIASPLTFTQPSSQSDTYNFTNNSTTNGVTLNLTGAISYTNTTRGYVIALNGSNTSFVAGSATGDNMLSGGITETVTTAGGFAWLVKSGVGTWVISGASSFTGGPTGSGAGNNPFTSSTYGVQINAGTLVAENNTAFGTSTTANNYKVNINNGGTLQIANNASTGSVTLDNGVQINLNTGGTLSANGTEAVNSAVAIGTAAATTVTIGTTNAADVFTIGNAANDLTGGAADTVLNIAGPGTVILGQASNYVGGFSINGGTLRMGNATAFGTTAKSFAFGAGSTGRLQLYGNSLSVTSLTTNATTPGSAIVENGAAGTATLTVNNAAANTYAGVLQNGLVGTLALTKSGTGALTLSGASSYSGGTTVSAGTLFVNNTAGSATGTGAVNFTGGTLAGSGTIAGAVTIAGHISPGAAGTGSVGNLTVGSLTLSAGSSLDYDINSTTALDQITVTNSGGLTINGGQFNINGATGTFTTNGIYNLIAYSGAVGGTGVSALTLNGTNEDLANHTYTFGLSGSYVTLTVGSSTTPADYYLPDASGAFSTGTNWSAGSPPNAVGAFAAFGGNGSTALTANRTVTVDSTYTVGTLAFNSTTGFGYTLANGGTGTGLTLNNGTSGAFVSDTAGSHMIAAPLTITPNGATFTVTAATDTLSVTGVVSSDANTDLGLTKGGNGTLALTGVNTYFGGTTLNGGTIQINSASSLGDTSGALTFGGGTLQLLTNVTSPRNYQVSGSNNAVIDTNGNSLALSGTVTPVGAATGGVVKNGIGILTLSGTNTYAGGTTINTGTVSVAADAGLGTAPASAATNITVNGGTLQATAGFTLNANRSITLNNTTSTIDVENAAVLTYAGVMSGSGALNLTGNGTLALSTVQTYTGNTFITGANLQYGVGAGLAGTITLNNGGTLTLQASNTTLLYPGNNITVAAGATATLSSNILGTAPGSLFTSGDATSVLDINGFISLGVSNTQQFTSSYTGTVHLNANTTVRFSGANNTTGNGGSTTTFDLGAGSTITTKGGGNITLGALTGTGALYGPGNFIVGTKNLSTTFPGTINSTATLNVAGTGTLTLTGASTFTGTTTINSGSTLQIDNGGTTGALGTGTVTNNGTFNYDRGDATTVATTFSGSGTLVVLGGTPTFTSEVDEGTINPRFGTTTFDPASAGLAANALNSTIGPIAGDNATVTVQNNGSYNVNSGNLFVGGLGTGTLNVNGPTTAGNGTTGGMVTLVAGLTIGNGATAVGTVNLNAGGTLTTPLINTAGGTSTLNLNGGTLVAASGATGTFLTGLTAANVLAGGAIINDGGNTITIAQALLTSPALAGATDGGLTKLGAGMLTLSAANTFNGGTTVSAGTLTIAANGGLGKGNVTIASGATLSLATGVTFGHNGAIGTTLTLADATSVLNLAATTAGTVQDVVGSLVVAGTTYTATGYYGSSTSGVAPAFQLPEFTGNGVIGLNEPAPVSVPEPTTWVMLLGAGGMILLPGIRRRHRA